MNRPAWLEAVAEICGSDAEDWRPVNAHGITWRWRDDDSTERTWSADSASIWHEGGGLWVEVRCYGEPNHAQLARAVRAGLAVARGDLDVDALQQQVATLTRERDELAAGPGWREIYALRTFAARVQAAHATPGCEREPVKLAHLPLLADRVVSAADRLAEVLDTMERIASAAGCPDAAPDDLPACVAALAGPVGPLVPDAVGLWWLRCGPPDGRRPLPVEVFTHGYPTTLRVDTLLGETDVRNISADRWLGPVAPPRGAR